MSMSILPITQDVTPTDIAQSGGTSRDLKPEEKSKVNSFAQANLKAPVPVDPKDKDVAVSINVQNAIAASADGTQVDAKEQATAMASKGGHGIRRAGARGKSTKKFEEMYEELFTTGLSEESLQNFLSFDLRSLNDGIRNKSKCLADLAPNLRPEDKALRKYLLVNIGLEEEGITKNEVKDLTTYRAELIKSHGDFITASISAFEVGSTTKLGAISLKEFIKAYQTIDIQSGTETSPEILSLFKSIKKNVSKDDFSKEIITMRNQFIAVLNREKTQNPKKITAGRHFIILSKINQLTVLAKTQLLHTKFSECCKVAKLESLPPIGNLMESCLQAVTSVNEALSGVNSLIRMASAVTSDRLNAKNIFMTNYMHLVLQSPLMKELYKNGSHRRQVTDGILKNLKSGAVLAIGARNVD